MHISARSLSAFMIWFSGFIMSERLTLLVATIKSLINKAIVVGHDKMECLFSIYL